MSIYVTLGISAVIIIFLLILVAVSRSAYGNGVRDGYQNTWLPHIKAQIREEQLQQGERVEPFKEHR